jgi:GAF domain-containing protein
MERHTGGPAWAAERGIHVDPTQDDQQIARVLVEMGGVLHSEQTVDRILQLVTELTERTVRTACAVSITFAGDDEPFTPNASATLARDLDEIQYSAGTGPCLTALAQHHTINTVLERSHERWPELAAAAISEGVGSVLSLPLMMRDRSLGALNIYSPDARPFDDTEATTASLLSQQAAAVLANAEAFASATNVIGQLQEALVTRDLIGQAKGILMAHEHCDANAAFDVLRRASQRTNRKLRDIAAEIVASTAGKATR